MKNYKNLEFDYDILETFIQDLENLLVFVSVTISYDGKSILVAYRSPFSERVIIPMDEYLSKVRNKKINLLLEL